MDIKIDDLKKQIVKIDTLSRTQVGIQNNNIEQKLDLILSSQDTVANNVAVTNTSTILKKPNRPVYFKSLYQNKRDEYMDVLYTQQLIDRYTQHPDVQKKAKQVDKDKKIATLIYDEHIKMDPEYKARYESIYLSTTD